MADLVYTLDHTPDNSYQPAQSRIAADGSLTTSLIFPASREPTVIRLSA